MLKVFAAAVIGEDPELFGFDFDPPMGSLARTVHDDRSPMDPCEVWLPNSELIIVYGRNTSW